MKRLFLCIFIMAFIVFWSAWGIFQTKKTHQEFFFLISQATQLKNDGNLTSALEKTKKSAQVWEDYTKKVSYICDCSDLKDISETVSQLELLVVSDSENFDLVVKDIENKITHLLEMEIPDLDGIF